MLDCHCHVLPREITDNLLEFADLDPHFGRLVTTKGARFASGADLIGDMDAIGLDRAVVFGFAFEDVGVCRLQNDYVAELCRCYPHRFTGLGVLCPVAKGAQAEAERCLEIGLHGFGELFPSGHSYSLDARGVSQLAGLARESNVPILVHVNEQVGHVYPGKGSAGPKEAYSFARANPDNALIFAHLGGGLPFFYSMPEVRKLKNVYYDTAAQPFLFDSGVYRVLKAAGALSKIILGSDYPLLGCKRYLTELEKSGLSPEEKDMILEVNGLALFGEYFFRKGAGN